VLLNAQGLLNFGKQCKKTQVAYNHVIKL